MNKESATWWAVLLLLFGVAVRAGITFVIMVERTERNRQLAAQRAADEEREQKREQRIRDRERMAAGYREAQSRGSQDYFSTQQRREDEKAERLTEEMSRSAW